jgi:hypothetical protein
MEGTGQKHLQRSWLHNRNGNMIPWRLHRLGRGPTRLGQIKAIQLGVGRRPRTLPPGYSSIPASSLHGAAKISPTRMAILVESAEGRIGHRVQRDHGGPNNRVHASPFWHTKHQQNPAPASLSTSEKTGPVSPRSNDNCGQKLNNLHSCLQASNCGPERNREVLLSRS